MLRCLSIVLTAAYTSFLTPVLGAGDNTAAAPAKWRDHTSPWLGSKSRPGNEERKNPFKIFDNVYYVGLNWVSTYLITTSDGLVLLDATYGDTVDQVLDNVRELGFNPADIRYVIVSHGHRDHYAGAGKIARDFGARVVMSSLDWDKALKEQAGGLERSGVPLQRDIEAKDGDTLEVGDTDFRFYVTPGHTPGALSVEYQVRDGERSYRALSPGGLGFNFGPDSTAAYIESYERLKKLGPWDTVLANHPHMGPRDLLDVEAELSTGTDRARNPAIFGPAKIDAWIDQILVSAHDKIHFENEHAPSRSMN